MLTLAGCPEYNPQAKRKFHRTGVPGFMETFLNIAMIIISIALIASVVLQSKGAGLGGLTGADSGGVFSARRGIEKWLFRVTIVFSIIFFVLSMISVMIAQPTLVGG